MSGWRPGNHFGPLTDSIYFLLDGIFQSTYMAFVSAIRGEADRTGLHLIQLPLQRRLLTAQVLDGH